MSEQEPQKGSTPADWAKEFERMMRGERTPEERDEARRLEEMDPRISPQARARLMNIRIGPGLSGDILSLRIGPPCIEE